MPYTEKQRKFFGAVASGKVRGKTSLSKTKALKMLHEGGEKGWKLKAQAKAMER